jgi:hypothetical protein
MKTKMVEMRLPRCRLRELIGLFQIAICSVSRMIHVSHWPKSISKWRVRWLGKGISSYRRLSPSKWVFITRMGSAALAVYILGP